MFNRIDIDNLKFVKHVTKPNIEVYKYRNNTMNSDKGPLSNSVLFTLVNVSLVRSR